MEKTRLPLFSQFSNNRFMFGSCIRRHVSHVAAAGNILENSNRFPVTVTNEKKFNVNLCYKL